MIFDDRQFKGTTPISIQSVVNGPKAELHCHLNGCVRKSTLADLLGHDAHHTDVVHTIDDAFEMFRNVYHAVDSEQSLRRILREYLEDAVCDNIRYVELRTTPRCMTDVPSKLDYVRILVDEMSRFTKLNNSNPLSAFPRDTIAVRLILTVNRAQSVSAAEETVDIALAYRDIVVGIDFAGNPTIGSFETFVDTFRRARDAGLKVTVHTSEISGVDKETYAILRFKPERMGHFIFASDRQIREALDKNIVIECCPTSNMCALSGRNPLDRSISGHNILEKLVRDPKRVCSINTDDPGVFNITLSEEFAAVATSFDLSVDELKSLMSTAASHAFLHEYERAALVQVIVRGDNE